MNRSCPSLWSSTPGAWVAAGMQAWVDARTLAPAPALAPSWIFVDRSLSQPDAWLAPLQGEVVYLDPSRDGLQQIAEWLHGSQGVHAVHILSQSAPGQWALGATVADALSLCDEHADPLAIIAGALSANAVLTLHGSDFATDASGAKLIATLAAVTGAQVKVQADVPARDNTRRQVGDGPASASRPASAGQPADRGEWLVAEAQVRAALLSAFQSAAREPVQRLGPLTPPRRVVDEFLAETSHTAPVAHC
jgi:hypothetical protein